VFAGLALVFERPFDVGHWIQLGEVVGKVQQINWRAVRITTREFDEVTIPNSALAKERIVNYSRPNRAHGLRVHIGFSYDVPPNQVKEMLLEVAFSTKGVLVSPAPDFRVHNYASYSIDYEILFFIADYEDVNRIRNDFMTNVWYAARRHGISIPYPIQTVHKIETPPPAEPVSEIPAVTGIIRSVPLFAALSADEAEALATKAVVERYGRGESVVREGDEGACLYVLLEGNCNVFVKSGDERIVTVASISSGDVVGEMSLLAGEPRSATVQAATDVRAARIDKDAISELLAARPELMSEFAKYAASRSAAIQTALESEEKGKGPSRTMADERALLQRIRRFFGL
jgi:CRP-like cAMP-binding protein